MAISWTENYLTATINMPNPLNEVIVNGSTVSFAIPSVQAKMTGNYMSPPFYVAIQMAYTPGSGWAGSGGLALKHGSTVVKQLYGRSTGTVGKNTYANIVYEQSADVTLTTSNYFNSSNANDRTVVLSYVAPKNMYVNGYEPGIQDNEVCYNPDEKTLSTITLKLDVPPEATVSAVSYDKPFVYAGLTTASVTISGATAAYGGSITDVTLNIGAQSASIIGNGTISILLDTAGTFTPTVKVTDSRGQTKTYTLSPITVNTYTAPTVSFTAERTNSSGKPDEEGTYATCPSMFIFADAIADLIAPSVVLTDENGTQTTPTVSWYTTRAADGTLSGVISDWSSVSAGDTVYGLVPGLNTNYSYQISIRPRDSQGTGTAITQTVASAFYTIDFLAGGHGIAFGQPSSQPGFECNMPTTFHDTFTVEDDADFGADVFIELPDYQTSSTTDKAIYDALVALGWDSDVLS